MKLRLLLNLVAVSALAYSASADSPQYSWAESYGFGSYGTDGKTTDDPFYGSGFDYPVGIAQMPDGGYVVAGQLDLPELYNNVYIAHTSANSCASLVRLAADGTILWQRVLRQSNDDTQNGYFYPASSHVYQIATDAAGNIFICGGKGNTSNSGQQPFVAKFDPNGGLVWDNGLHDGIWVVGDNPVTFEKEGVGPFTTMALTHDGGVVAGSVEYKPGNSQNRPMVAKFNSDGSLAMHAVYEVPVQYIGVSAIAQGKNSDNYVFVIQHPASGSFAPNPHGLTAIEITPAGDVVQEKSFAPDDGRIETPTQIIATSDGGYATFSQAAKGYSGGIVLDAGGFVLRKFDDKLNATFGKTYSRPGQNTSFYANHLSETADGGFLVAGHNSSGIANDAGFDEVSLTRIGANGQLLFVSVVGGGKAEGVSSYGPSSGAFALQSVDGGYAFVTASNSYGDVVNSGFGQKPDWWLVKTDSNRRVQNFADDLRELPLTQFSVKDTTRPGGPGEVTRISPDVVVGATQTSQPAFIFENPAQNAAPNAPAVKYQAAPFLGGVSPSPTLTFSATQPFTSGRVFRFSAIEQATGVTMRVQYSATPTVQSSWTDLADGEMTLIDSAHGLWELDTINVPQTRQPDGSDNAVAFRSIASASGQHDSVSNPTVPINVGAPPQGAAPTAAITASASDAFINAGTDLPVTVSITSSGGVQDVALLDNGQIVSRTTGNGGSELTITISQVAAGKHFLTAIVTDYSGLQGVSEAVSVLVNPLGGKTYTLVGAGDWFSPANWQDAQGQPGVPGGNDLALIGSGAVDLSQGATVAAATLDGGAITGVGGLTINQRFTISAGQITNAALTIGPNGVCEIVGDNDVEMSTSVTNYGTWLMSGYGGINGVGTGTRGSAKFAGNQSGDAALGFNFSFFRNIGQFLFPPRPARANSNGRTPPAPVVHFSALANAGRLIAPNGGSLIGPNGATIVSTSGSGVVGNSGGTIITHDGGSFKLPPNASAETTASGYTQTAGETDLTAIRIVGRVTIEGGSLTGSGLVDGDLSNSGGFVSPGHSAGSIEVTGDFAQGPNGTLVMEVASGDPTLNDSLQVGGTCSLGGALDVRLPNPAQLNNPTLVQPIVFGSLVGNFDQVSGNTALTALSNTLQFSVDPTVAGPQAGQPLNISTRMSVQTGDNVLIGGFIITGSSPKKVIIRAIGPSLPVSGKLADPTLELHTSDGTVVFNDNWREAQEQEIIESTVAPADDLESAIVATLPPGAHTAIVRGNNDGTGVGLVEVYDLDAGSASKLANISTRGPVQTGDNVMIGGFIVGGTEPAKILVRAIGPSLSLAGKLEDPVLELHDFNGTTFNNDNWRETQEAEIIASTIPPTSDNESAILATLTPGPYTAIVRGKNGTTGIAVVEAYNLQ